MYLIIFSLSLVMGTAPLLLHHLITQSPIAEQVGSSPLSNIWVLKHGQMSPLKLKWATLEKLFSTKIKKHLLTTDSADDYINVNNTNHQSQDVIIADLREIFEDSTDNGEFLGFENTSANIFENENDSLILMFDSDRENSEDFLGF